MFRTKLLEWNRLPTRPTLWRWRFHDHGERGRSTGRPPKAAVKFETFTSVGLRNRFWTCFCSSAN
ncbi:hypothetical protein CpipJ_CPIJ019451 [Culex quinquefasciatus]|uniref:Uncharacterized protein n=1 Tax=Culex quinquefasciatus TaxID=7176 RepID=B0XJA0_CULQU|nr:hypothetical protein CpipJ_CPIJ019451 [Culex quinquefasciatus]|eukprot:XP_001869722.1 hypothetical protein CpipJ_CPIJ019451 [Culex quinquefasciatus]